MKPLRERFAYSIVRDRADSFEIYSWRRFYRHRPEHIWYSWGQASERVVKKLWLLHRRQTNAARKGIWFNAMRTQTDRLRHIAAREKVYPWKNAVTRSTKLMREVSNGNSVTRSRLWTVRCALATTALNKLPMHPSGPARKVGPGQAALPIWDYTESSEIRWILCFYWNTKRPQFRGNARDLIWLHALLRIRVALDGSTQSVT